MLLVSCPSLPGRPKWVHKFPVNTFEPFPFQNHMYVLSGEYLTACAPNIDQQRLCRYRTRTQESRGTLPCFDQCRIYDNKVYSRENNIWFGSYSKQGFTSPSLYEWGVSGLSSYNMVNHMMQVSGRFVCWITEGGADWYTRYKNRLLKIHLRTLQGPIPFQDRLRSNLISLSVVLSYSLLVPIVKLGPRFNSAANNPHTHEDGPIRTG